MHLIRLCQCTNCTILKFQRGHFCCCRRCTSAAFTRCLRPAARRVATSPWRSSTWRSSRTARWRWWSEPSRTSWPAHAAVANYLILPPPGNCIHPFEFTVRRRRGWNPYQFWSHFVPILIFQVVEEKLFCWWIWTNDNVFQKLQNPQEEFVLKKSRFVNR